MGRVDLYAGVHKGLRALFARVAAGVARTDFRKAADAVAAAGEVRELLELLREHVAHEDGAVLALLAGPAPELHAQLVADHGRARALEGELELLLERLTASVSLVEREALGKRLHERLWALFAEHLRHMAFEETRVNRILWAHLGDEELRAIQTRILASIAQERLARWLTLVLPAMNGPERAAMLAGLRGSGMRHEVFEQLTAGARAVLGPGPWTSALAVSQLAQEPVA